ncbi:MAG: AN1-type zinc finger protein [Haloferacaceae archaeon]
MARCQVCGDEIVGEEVFVCSLCEAPHCVRHRIPETHDCPRLDAATPPEASATATGDADGGARAGGRGGASTTAGAEADASGTDPPPSRSEATADRSGAAGPDPATDGSVDQYTTWGPEAGRPPGPGVDDRGEVIDASPVERGRGLLRRVLGASGAAVRLLAVLVLVALALYATYLVVT